MREAQSAYQSHNHLYLRIWLVSSAFLVAFRFMGISQVQRAYIVMTYVGFSWLALGGVGIYEGQRLAHYLNSHRSDLVKRGRYGFGLTGLDTWHLLGLSDAIKKSNDTTAIWLLENYTRFLGLLVLALISYLALFVIMVL
jgi:hypothetical protein